MSAIGKRDQLIRFEEATREQGGSGADVLVFRPAYECWAARRPASGLERFNAQQIDAQADVIYNVRDPGTHFPITPVETLRIVDLSDGSKTYDITRVDKLDRRRELEITARTKAA